MERKIILASTSPRRKELMQRTNIKFEICSADYDEDMTLPLPPDELVVHLSRGKANSVAMKYRDAVIIAADTIIALDGKILGKPHTKERAREMLEMLNNRFHQVITGITIMEPEKDKMVSRAVISKVKFKKLSEREIFDYIETGEPLDKAGAYAIQGMAKKFIETTEGDISNIIGLPIPVLLEELRMFGINTD